LEPLGNLPKNGGAKCLAISPDSRILATGGMDRVIRLWDVAARKEVRQLVGQQGAIWSLAFSPDGKTIAAVTAKGAGVFIAGDGDRNIRAWDVATGRLLRTMNGPPDGSWCIAWSPDGRVLATGDEDSRIRLWEWATGQERACLVGHEGPVTALAFTAGGQRLVSGSSDTTGLVWDLRPGKGPVPAMRSKDMAELWANLAADDARKAYQALVACCAIPEQSVAWLQARLRPAIAPDSTRLARLIADLERVQFAVRDRAVRELAALGDLAAPALRRELENRPSLETRQRLERLLRSLDELTPDQRRGIRAVEMLENIGTPAARKLLQTLASGAPTARLTREAQAALDRLNRKLCWPR
jgi:hypothetical protein